MQSRRDLPTAATRFWENDERVNMSFRLVRMATLMAGNVFIYNKGLIIRPKT